MKTSLLINIKMPFIFINRGNFMFSRAEHETSFITLGPGAWCLYMCSVCSVPSIGLDNGGYLVNIFLISPEK